MNARELQDEAQKSRTNASSKRADADRMKVTASGHEERGDSDMANAEKGQIEQLEAEAAEMEKRADELDAEAAHKLQEAGNIEKQQADLRRQMESQLGELEAKKTDLTGGKIGLF